MRGYLIRRHPGRQRKSGEEGAKNAIYHGTRICGIPYVLRRHKAVPAQRDRLMIVRCSRHSLPNCPRNDFHWEGVGGKESGCGVTFIWAKRRTLIVGSVGSIGSRYVVRPT
jgi:hypothetical protein